MLLCGWVFVSRHSPSVVSVILSLYCLLYSNLGFSADCAASGSWRLSARFGRAPAARVEGSCCQVGGRAASRSSCALLTRRLRGELSERSNADYCTVHSIIIAHCTTVMYWSNWCKWDWRPATNWPHWLTYLTWELFSSRRVCRLMKVSWR